MAKSSLLGGDRAPTHPSGKGSDLLGPSDSSDSGSDAQGEFSPEQLNSDTDRSGTGERASADLRDSGRGDDILPDRVDHLERDTAAGEGEGDRLADDLAAEDDIPD